MKILGLKLKNFTTFRGIHEFDFQKFSDNQLFSISGPTGSGKSSILNAISLALYGQSYKKELNQNDYITLGESEASVELKISLNQDIYECFWMCKTKKKNGEALKRPISKRTLFHKGEILEKSIQDLIDLNFDQFTKTVILNQGEFAKFLTSTFTQRKEILENLYHGEKLKKFSVLLKSEIHLLKQELDKEQAKIETLKEVQIERPQKLEQSIKELSIHKDIQSLEIQEKEEKLKDCKTEKEIYEQLKRNIERALHNKKDLEKEQESNNKGKRELEAIKKDVSNQLAQFKKKRKAFEIILGQIQTEDKLKKEQLYHEQRIAKSNEQLENIEKRLKDLGKVQINKDQIERIKDYYPLKDQVHRDIEKLQETIKKEQYLNHETKILEIKRAELQEKLNKMHYNQEDFEKRKKSQIELKNQKESLLYEISRVKEKGQSLSKEIKDTEEKFNESDLKESINMNLKNLSTSFKIEYIKSLNTDLTKYIYHYEKDLKLSKLSKTREQYKELNTRKEEIDKKIDKNQESINDDDHLQKFKNTIQHELLEYDTKIKDNSSKRETLGTKETLEKYKFEKIDQLLQLDKDLSHLHIFYQRQNETNTRKKEKEEIKQLKTSLNHIKEKLSELPKHSHSSLEIKELLTLEEEKLDKLRLVKEQKEKDYNQGLLQLKTLESTATHLKQEELSLRNLLKGSEHENIEEKVIYFRQLEENLTLVLKNLKKQLEETIKEKAQLDEQFQLFQKNLKQQQEIQRNVKSLNKALRPKEGLYLFIGRDELRNYILKHIEKNLLIFANNELKKLYQGRFKIVHGGKDHTDLYIQDYFQGLHERKVSTLSGGETFIVSLGLALALAELTRGQTEIGSFFIDEGFGTLDKDSLEDVINVLLELKGQGKQIGIITHVEELNNRIEHSIQLTKTL